MSFVESSSINTTISWKQVDRLRGQTVLIDNGLVESEYAFSSGTGIDSVNLVWHGQGEIEDNSFEQFDLFDLNRVFFGQNININLSGGKLKTLFIKNLNTGFRDLLFYPGAESTAFDTPFNGDNPIVSIEANSSLLLSYTVGWDINTNSHTFYLENDHGSAHVEYEMVVLGSI